MRAFVPVIALLFSAPTPLSEGQRLAKAETWVELYLAYSAQDVTGYSRAERKELAGLHERGARALEASDLVMAFSLAERAAAFDASADRLLLLARTALAAEQRDSAEEVLRRGLKLHPSVGAFGLGLGRLLLEDHDAAGAVAALSAVPTKSKESAEASRLLQSARAQVAAEKEALAQARAIERRFEGGGTTQPAGALSGPAAQTRPSSGWESSVGPDGMRTRTGRRFVFRYFNNQRDFGQRAEYEGKVADALETAYTFTRRILGRARETPVDVVLYTREEFATHFGPQTALMVAGFYGEGAIRMNDAARLDARARSVIVHEYVHAAVDELAGFNARRVPLWVNEGLAEYVQWRFLGSENPPHAVATALRSAAARDQVPRLEDMTDRALITQSQPALAYGTSAIAVRLLLKTGGPDNLLGLIADVGEGRPFAQVLAERYGRDLERLNREVRDELKRR
jgi:hypothetical protein